MAFKELTSGEVFKFDQEGVSLEGEYLGVTEKPSKFGPKAEKLYSVLSGGKKKTFFGCTQLNETLAGVTLGTILKITYTGKKETRGGNTMKVFTVLADAPEVSSSASA
jgi:hypothetical protein